MMVAQREAATPALTQGSEHSLAQCLERGEVLYYPSCPFALPTGQDHQLLLKQRLGGGHKNISYNPHNRKTKGYRQTEDPGQGEQLRRILATFSATASRWLAGILPSYAEGWKLDMVSFRPEEEATRFLRLTSRNDLLHVDAFPSRPTRGYRILRLFCNINLTEPRVWATSDPFAKLLERYGAEAGFPVAAPSWARWWNYGKCNVFNPYRPARTVYDQFMVRFHNFLKANDLFQENCPKQFWHFQPGSAWLVMTDTASHAALRGRFALEHSYFIDPQTLALPQEAPAALLERACGLAVVPKVA